MKKWVILIIGIIIGSIITLSIVLMANSYHSSNKIGGVKMFEQPQEVVNEDYFKVDRVLKDNAALVYGLNYWGEPDIVYLLINNEGKSYYDGQEIYARDKEVRQVGVYKYKTNEGDQKTVAVIEIMPK